MLVERAIESSHIVFLVQDFAFEKGKRQQCNFTVVERLTSLIIQAI
jgi:hypothetical protein